MNGQILVNNYFWLSKIYSIQYVATAHTYGSYHNIMYHGSNIITVLFERSTTYQFFIAKILSDIPIMLKNFRAKMTPLNR